MVDSSEVPLADEGFQEEDLELVVSKISEILASTEGQGGLSPAQAQLVQSVADAAEKKEKTSEIVGSISKQLSEFVDQYQDKVAESVQRGQQRAESEKEPINLDEEPEKPSRIPKPASIDVGVSETTSYTDLSSTGPTMASSISDAKTPPASAAKPRLRRKKRTPHRSPKMGSATWASQIASETRRKQVAEFDRTKRLENERIQQAFAKHTVTEAEIQEFSERMQQGHEQNATRIESLRKQRALEEQRKLRSKPKIDKKSKRMAAGVKPLADRSQEILEQSQQRIAQMRIKKEMDLARELHGPVINKASKRMAAGQHRGQVSGDEWLRQRNENIRKQREAKEAKELREATFKPAISAMSRKILERNSGLSRDASMERLTKERRPSQPYQAEAAFHPEINERSKQMKRGGNPGERLYRMAVEKQVETRERETVAEIRRARRRGPNERMPDPKVAAQQEKEAAAREAAAMAGNRPQSIFMRLRAEEEEQALPEYDMGPYAVGGEQVGYYMPEQQAYNPAVYADPGELMAEQADQEAAEEYEEEETEEEEEQEEGEEGEEAAYARAHYELELQPETQKSVPYLPDFNPRFEEIFNQLNSDKA